MFTQRQPGRSNMPRKGLMPLHIIRMRGLLEPIRVHVLQPRTNLQRLWHGPLLIGVQHDLYLIAGSLPYNMSPTYIPIRIRRSYFQLHGGKTIRDALDGILPDLLVRIVEPADRGLIAWLPTRKH